VTYQDLAILEVILDSSIDATDLSRDRLALDMSRSAKLQLSNASRPELPIDATDAAASPVTRTAISLEYASLRHSGHCPLGLYVVPSVENLLVWDGVLFVHQGKPTFSLSRTAHEILPRILYRLNSEVQIDVSLYVFIPLPNPYLSLIK
jgi:hypothetical protein